MDPIETLHRKPLLQGDGAISPDFHVATAIGKIFFSYNSDGGRLLWRVMAAINALACLSVPAINALTTQGNIVSYLLNKQWALFIFDAVFLLFSILFLVQTEKLRTASSASKKTANNLTNNKKRQKA